MLTEKTFQVSTRGFYLFQLLSNAPLDWDTCPFDALTDTLDPCEIDKVCILSMYSASYKRILTLKSQSQCSNVSKHVSATEEQHNSLTIDKK